MFETQGVLGRSRQVGSVPEVTAIERTQRGSKHFASLRSASCSKPRATRQEPLKKVQGGVLITTRPPSFGRLRNEMDGGSFLLRLSVAKTAKSDHSDEPRLVIWGMSG